MSEVRSKWLGIGGITLTLAPQTLLLVLFTRIASAESLVPWTVASCLARSNRTDPSGSRWSGFLFSFLARLWSRLVQQGAYCGPCRSCFSALWEQNSACWRLPRGSGRRLCHHHVNLPGHWEGGRRGSRQMRRSEWSFYSDRRGLAVTGVAACWRRAAWWCHPSLLWASGTSGTGRFVRRAQWPCTSWCSALRSPTSADWACCSDFV